ncbi:MAG: c-type cytochrome biogenesis protein CcmI [Rhizobiales bacterium]|nr:c-type cytochrome biogenesis protein CcmI [Hyphomicrobiales bacterium]
MSLWFVLSMLTAAAVFAVLWPLGRGRAPSAEGTDIEVYRDQLAELERDRAAGLIPAQDYDAARTEVARRLLAADAAQEGASAAAPWRRRIVVLLAFLALPLGALSLYGMNGRPAMPGQPLAERQRAPLADRSIEDLVTQVESHLERNPEDGRGWEVVAPVYMRLGRFDDAVKARANALRLNGATAERDADYGEALVAAANGIVTADARSAFERTRKEDAANAKARYYLGLAAEQEGDRAAAVRAWKQLLAEARPDTPWAELVRNSLARAAPQEASREAPAPPAAPSPGPGADDVKAAAALSPQERDGMVRGMVDRLAARLRDDGSDLDGWKRLMRAYMVLGERDKALAALADGRRAAAAEPERLREINEAGRDLGLGD